jgi:NAD(P)-dependent dehydrogenase (short-subunit alcohol dehydrogenase family)
VADGADLADIDRVFATISAESGRLDVLFASAARNNTDTLHEMTPEAFDQVFGLNVRGTLFTAQRAVELMTRGGSIILNGSAAVEMARPGVSVYAASKATLRSFARVWSQELAAQGIRVNVLHPGPIDTAMMATLPLPAQEQRAALTMLGRLGRPEEIASAALFLASEDAGYVTATELFVSGGMEIAQSR